MSKVPYNAAQVHMLEISRNSIRQRIQHIIDISQDTAESFQRTLERDEPIENQLSSLMSRLRNSHNTIMGEMESAIRSLAEMLEITHITAQEQMERADKAEAEHEL
jgi:hypothetical protein